ncbi:MULTISPECIES: DUF1761 domain-containing protein [unclassified Microbacterium]|uniref:DUF1761 domain-containing protein n=1 Tax=unclassified Microbacterium TaxID=2609290 RepID=UPI0012FA872F|nr:DUF1761 domain-containing protein [Microbacterium sp. MAH-37]
MILMIAIGIAVATIAAFVLSTVYYMLATPLEQRAAAGRAIERDRPGPLKIVAELVRTAVLASGFSWVAAQAGMLDLPGSLLLALVLWLAFPVVLLAGSVGWDRAPMPTAVLHGGDWLLKLLLIAVVIGLLH